MLVCFSSTRFVNEQNCHDFQRFMRTVDPLYAKNIMLDIVCYLRYTDSLYTYIYIYIYDVSVVEIFGFEFIGYL
jgi:hypothetical protein